MPASKRRKAPPVQRIAPIPFPEVQHFILRNGIAVYALPHPTQEALKVEWVFLAGRPEESKPLAARATARLLREGAGQYNSATLAEWFDYYGSSLQTPAALDTANLVMYSLRKYAGETLPLFAEIIHSPTFPAHELALFQQNNVQELLVDLEKVEVVAYRELTGMLFGAGHPYGYNSTPDMYMALTRDDLVAHHTRLHTPARSAVFLSGGVDDRVLAQIERLFGHLANPDDRPVTPALPTVTDLPQRRHIPHPGSLQTAIKVGRRLFNRHHPHYNGMLVLNTVLGGYFGSRLSAHVRENLGFTYNIYSSVDALVHDGFLYIATEVDQRNAEATLQEIFAEMRRLQEEPIPEAELDMVRNYLFGMLLNGLDGPLNSSVLLRSYVIDKLPLDAYRALTDTVRNITPEELTALAQLYLRAEDYSVVTVG